MEQARIARARAQVINTSKVFNSPFRDKVGLTLSRRVPEDRITERFAR